jgi:hypothetical protein
MNVIRERAYRLALECATKRLEDGSSFPCPYSEMTGRERKIADLVSHYAGALIFVRNTLAHEPPAPMPTTVCLCGSSRFRDHFRAAEREETLAGRIVLSLNLFGHLEGLDMDGPTKVMLDQLHFRRIDMADEILVINPDDYIGTSTTNQIAYARQLCKPIRYLFPHGGPT